MKYLRTTVAVVILWYMVAFFISFPIVPYPCQVVVYFAMALVEQKMLCTFFSSILVEIGNALLFVIPTDMLAGRVKAIDEAIFLSILFTSENYAAYYIMNSRVMVYYLYVRINVAERRFIRPQ